MQYAHLNIKETENLKTAKLLSQNFMVHGTAQSSAWQFSISGKKKFYFVFDNVTCQVIEQQTMMQTLNNDASSRNFWN